MAVCGFMNTGGNLGGIIGLPIVGVFHRAPRLAHRVFHRCGLRDRERRVLACRSSDRLARTGHSGACPASSERMKTVVVTGAAARSGVRRRGAVGAPRLSRRADRSQAARCASAAIAGAGWQRRRNIRRCGVGILRARAQRASRARVRCARCTGQQRRHQSDRSRREHVGGTMAAGDERQPLRAVSVVQILGRADVVPRAAAASSTSPRSRAFRASLTAVRTTPRSTASSA